MAEARIKDEILRAKTEIQRLRECISNMSVGSQIVHKDLSLVTLVPKWSGTDAPVTLEEYLSSIVSAAKIGPWSDPDKRKNAVLKLTDSAKLFCQRYTELHAESTTWQSFKDAFKRRYFDVHTDQHHFTKLQTARQKKANLHKNFQTGVGV